MMMGYWNNGMGWWGWLGISVFMVIFWGLVIWGIVALVRTTNGRERQEASSGQSSTTTESILAERFAKGEIDEREYVGKQEILRSTSPTANQASSEERLRTREIETAAH
jgi:putative membrane protein